MRGSNQPATSAANCEKLHSTASRWKEEHSNTNCCARTRREFAPLFHTPQFPAVIWVIPVGSSRSQADQLRLSINRGNVGSGKRLAIVTVCGWLSIRIQVLKVH